MSAQFVSASSHHLINSATPITGYPFTVGMWVRPRPTGTEGLWSIGDTSALGNHFALQITTTQWQIRVQDAGGQNTSAGSNTVHANAWNYVIVRGISATNRRLDIIKADGTMDHTQGTTSKTPASVDTMAIGGRVNGFVGLFCNADIADFWYTDTDIQPDGGALQNSTLRQLAYGGPFSLPHIAKDIVEYRSFRSRLDSRADIPDEVYYRGTRPVWTNMNGVQLGPHPPAASLYQKPIWVPKQPLHPRLLGLIETGGAPPATVLNTLMMMGYGP